MDGFDGPSETGTGSTGTGFGSVGTGTGAGTGGTGGTGGSVVGTGAGVLPQTIFGWQVVYKGGQPPQGQAPPAPPVAPSPGVPGTAAPAGSLQQLLAQRPILTMLEQNIAAIASGVGVLQLAGWAGRPLHVGYCCHDPSATLAA